MKVLGDIAKVIDCEHRTAPKTEDVPYGFSVGTSAVRHGRIDLARAKPISKETFVSWTRRATPEIGDLIFSREAPMGEVGMVPGDIPVCLGQRTVLMRLDRQQVDHRFLLYSLMSPHSQAWINENSAGSTVLHLNVADVRRIPIHFLPSLDEQHLIVKLLEDHISRLDAADAYLDAGQRRLDAMERAALASSRDGELFPLAEVTEIQGGIQKQQKRAPKDNAFPFLRVANVTARGLDLADVHSIELFDRELDRIRLRAGDLLVVEGNGSASQIGRAALWDGSIEDCVHQNHLIRVRPFDVVLPEYLEAVWNSPQNRAKLTNVASSSSGLHTLSVSKLKQLSIPVPSIGRQHELVAAVSEVREAGRRLSGSIATAVARKGALQRSLLAAAFSGRLTGAPSEPPPAEALINA